MNPLDKKLKMRMLQFYRWVKPDRDKISAKK